MFIHAAHILSLLWRKLWVMYAREKETVALMQNNLKRFRSKHTASLESMKAAIEEQFNDWKLSKAESSVARQLILGYSFQRIASANGKSVKTIQNHATSIYNKAMVNGRSDLAAFFLCDLFED
ncbi:MAG: response regulator transcription factor [Leptospiraceae bacterium]|nr:response regulator transcription factor [Leptospiraceae bacterium]MCB1322384.1 response regulator transcription factor [Leptospiraceae bacterium]